MATYCLICRKYTGMFSPKKVTMTNNVWLKNQNF